MNQLIKRTYKIFFSALFLFSFQARAMASHVSVQKSTDGWSLQVGGRPFFIKGVGCNVAEGKNKEDYLKMAKDMGANAVRTWGFVPAAYFDKAEAYGLLVDAGVWYDAIGADTVGSYTDPDNCRFLKEETLAYVRKMKHHPALLMWNLGNEVFAHTESEEEKQAFGVFLDDLVQAVHQEDPDHPVVYSGSEFLDLPYVKALVPHLDIVGVNSYDAYDAALNWLNTNDFDKPVVATEYGCKGAWNAAKDANQVPLDPFDQFKAKAYLQSWRKVERTPAQSLGGFAFTLGESPNQFSVTWWNINFGTEKRQAYWSLYTAYTGQEPSNHCPVISQFSIDHSTDVRPGDQIMVTLVATDPDKDKLSTDYFIADIEPDPLIQRPPHLFTPQIKRISASEARLSIPTDAGLYRVYAVVRDGHENVAIANRSIEIRPAVE